MQTFLCTLVRLYRYLLSPLFGSHCRFHPSCSAYALEALQTHGALRGSWLSASRLLRCNPLCAGGLDPVPPPGATCAANAPGEDSPCR